MSRKKNTVKQKTEQKIYDGKRMTGKVIKVNKKYSFAIILSELDGHTDRLSFTETDRIDSFPRLGQKYSYIRRKNKPGKQSEAVRVRLPGIYQEEDYLLATAVSCEAMRKHGIVKTEEGKTAFVGLDVLRASGLSLDEFRRSIVNRIYYLVRINFNHSKGPSVISIKFYDQGSDSHKLRYITG